MIDPPKGAKPTMTVSVSTDPPTIAPPKGATLVVKKKDEPDPSSEDGSTPPGPESSSSPAEQQGPPLSTSTDPSVKSPESASPAPKENSSNKFTPPGYNPHDPLGIGETVLKQLYTGFTDQIPKAMVMGSEIGVSAIQSANVPEFIKRKKAVEFQRYVRDKEGLSPLTPFDINKYLDKYKDQFIQDKGYGDVQKEIEAVQPHIIQRRTEIENYIQQQNKESGDKMKGIPQSFKDVHGPAQIAQFAANMAAQGLWQIPLTIATRGLSGAAMEAAAVYENQVDELAEKHGLTRQEVIKRGLDSPATGQIYALAAAGLDLASAGGLASLVRKGGSSALKKLLAVTQETLTEPIQGSLEETGGAVGAGKSATDAFEKAWSVNLSRRLDESLGGLFGSAGPTIAGQARTVPDVVKENTNLDITNPAAARAAAAQVKEAFNNPQPPTTNEPLQTPGQAPPIGAAPVQQGESTDVSANPPEATLPVQGDKKEQGAAVEELPSEEIQKRMRPHIEEMVDVEEQFKTAGYDIDWDHDNEIIVTDANGIVAPEDLPDNLRELAGQYETATAKLAGFSNADFQTVKQDVRKSRETTAEVVESNPLADFKQKRIDLARQYHEEERNPTNVTAEESAIASNISKVTGESVARFGDKNAITTGMAKAYISKDGFTIDQVAQAASASLGSEVTPDQVWEFMKKYQSGPRTISTPAGNQKLKAISDEYSKLTGKGINSQIAKDIHDTYKGEEKEQAPAETTDDATSIAELEADPEAFKGKHGISSDEELNYIASQLYERQQQKTADRPADAQNVPQQGAEGGTISERFGDQAKDPAALAAEITSQPLTHVQGLNMGKGLAAGTYLSTEEENRYGKGQPATTTVKKPFVFKSENGIIPFRNQILNDNIAKFGEEDFEDFVPFKDDYTLDDLSDSGIDKLAEMVRTQLQAEGFDSIYMPATATQEGELIIFDRDNVQIATSNEGVGATVPVPSEPSTTDTTTDVGQRGREPGAPQEPNRTNAEGISDQPELSGIKKELVPEEKVAETPTDKRTDQQMLAEGKAAVDSGKINPSALVTELNESSRALQPLEVAALVYYKAQLDNQLTAATTEAEKTALLAQLDAYHEMAVTTAAQQSMAFRLRKMLLDSEYNLQSQVAKYKAVNKTGEVPADVMAKLTQLDNELREANRKIDELKTQFEEKQRDYFLKQVQAEERRRRAKDMTVRKKKEVDDFFNKLLIDTSGNQGKVFSSVLPGVTLIPEVWNGAVKAIREAIKAGYDVAYAVQAGIDYVKAHSKDKFDEEAFKKGMTPIVRQIVPKEKVVKQPKIKDGQIIIPSEVIRNLVADGITDIEDLATEINKMIPEATHRDIRDAITKYGRTANMSQEELDVEIRKMKRAGRLISAMEDVQRKMRPKRSGLQRDKLSDEERRMQRDLKEALKNLPVNEEDEAELWKTAIQAVKTRLNNQIRDLEEQIATGQKSPKKAGIQYDQEALDLQTRRDELKAIVEAMEGKRELSDEQRVRMAIQATEKAITDYERRIAEKDFSKPNKKQTPVTPELADMKAKRQAAKDAYDQLREQEGLVEKDRLEARKKAVRAAIDNYQQRIKDGDFARKQAVAPKVDEETRKLLAERERIKHEFDVLQEKNRLANRSLPEKIQDFGLDVWNAPKSLVTTIDLSALLRQGAVLLPSHPISWAKAFVNMFALASSQKRYDAWLNNLKASELYPLIKDSKLFISDTNAKMSAQEETFMSKLARHIPIIGQSIQLGKNIKIPGLDLVGFSARAYSGFLNNLRVNVFASGVEELQKSKDAGLLTARFKDKPAMTFESHPEEYKKLADFINNATGRGKLLKVGQFDLEKAAPVLNAVFFSPRFVASRINLVNPVYYAKLPPEARREALKSVLAFIAFGMSILAMFKASGYSVELNPKSTDFGKIKDANGKTRYDIWAGFSNIIRAIVQIATGEKKTAEGDIIDKNRWETTSRFLRGKLSPAAGTVADVLVGKTMTNEPVTVEGEVLKNTVPLYIQDMQEMYEQEGGAGVAATALPAMFGIGVQSYEPTKKPSIYERIMKRIEGAKDVDKKIDRALDNAQEPPW